MCRGVGINQNLGGQIENLWFNITLVLLESGWANAHPAHPIPTALMRVDAFYYWKKRASSSLDKMLEEQLKIMHTDQD